MNKYTWYRLNASRKINAPASVTSCYISLLLTSTLLNASPEEILAFRPKLLVLSLLRTLEQTGVPTLLSSFSAPLPQFKRCSHGLETSQFCRSDSKVMRLSCYSDSYKVIHN